MARPLVLDPDTLTHLAMDLGTTPDRLIRTIQLINDFTPPQLDNVFFDREGKSISFGEWSALTACTGYVELHHTVLAPDIMIRTAWTGFAKSANKRPPCVFHTVIERDDKVIVETELTNEADATRVHNELVQYVTERGLDGLGNR